MTTLAVVGLDMGSTNIKVLVATQGGEELFVLSTPSPWTTRESGHTEMGAADVTASVLEILQQAGVRLRELPGEHRVTAIGVSGMAEAGVLIGGDGSAAAPIIAWFDPRGEQEILATPDAFRAEFAGRTGLPVGPIATIAKLLHLKGTGVGLTDKRWLNLPEYVAYILGGRPATEHSLASRTGLLDQDTGRPWPAALDILGVGDDFLPEPCSAGDAIGHVGHPMLSDIFRGATVTIAGHDHLVSAVAAGAMSSTQLYNSMGTAEAIIRILDTQLSFEARERLAVGGINALRHVIPGKYVLLAATKAGLLMRRVFQMLGISDAAGRDTIDAATLALPVHGMLIDGISVTGARNDDGVLRVRVNSDGASPAELFTATLLHGNDMCAELIEVMNREVPAATSSLLTGGWAGMSSVVRARQLVLPRVSKSAHREDTAFGAALFAAYAATETGVHEHEEATDAFIRFAAAFCAVGAHSTAGICQ